MPIIVGIILSIIFLIAFSEWAYHMVTGWGELVLDDVYFRYRIIGVSLFSIILISATFYVMALVNECPNEEREGLMAGLQCEEYFKIKAGTDKVFANKVTETQEL